MEKFRSSLLFFFIAFTFFAFTRVNAQSITIQNFITGVYTPGSSIGVPFNISASTTCINQNNIFQLYLADGSGNIVPGGPIGTFTGFYGTFVNGVIPANTAPGTYTVVVKCTNPAVSSAPSATFTIAAGPAITAAITGPSISSSYPDVFGNCNGGANTPFSFNNSSTPPVATANFFNETTQQTEGTLPLTNAAPTTFTATGTNYTVIVSTTNGTSIATQAYLLINNVVHNGLTTSGSNTFCYTTGLGSAVTFPIDVTSPNGLQYNFPGNLYLATWGDGTTSTYTICDLITSGQISHTYTTGSCGHVANGLNNVFEVDFQPENAYCGLIGTRTSTDAKVIKAPVNKFTTPASSCSNAKITFTNTSDPGEDANSNSSDCVNTTALYTWSVDNVIQKANALLSETFSYTFTTNGSHTVTLTLQAGHGVACPSQPATEIICIQNPPKPAFTLPATTICLSNTLTPADASIVDNGCSAANTYLWTVTGPAPVSYAGNTTQNSQQPQFLFTQSGSYQITLSISSATCGTVTTQPQSVNVDDVPVINLSPNVSVCGTNQTFSFNTNPGPTQTTITGTPQGQPNAYNWTVSGGAYSFANGTTATSQYPDITFTDYSTYTISVTQTNICGTIQKTQTITFLQAPATTISSSTPNICPGNSATLTANITDPSNSVTGETWAGSGTFSAASGLTTIYTPTASEVAAGNATVTLTVLTSLPGQCASIPVNYTINIYPVNTINSAATTQICTGNALNYAVTSNVPSSTYSWTSVLTSGTATGFTSGTGATINDVITNNDPVNNAVITYTITPVANSCTGTPFTLTVTVNPTPVAKGVPVDAIICSSAPANINLTSNIAGTTYTWTSSVTGNVTGNSQQTSPLATSTINDVFFNNGTTTGTVTYVVTPYNGTCPGQPFTTSITVQPLPVTANPGPNDEVCNQTFYKLNGNSAAPGTGLWTVTSGPAGWSFDDPTKPLATVTGLIPGNTYQFTWTITAATTCPPSSNTVTVIIDLPTVGGTTSGATTVCSDGNSGNVTLSGQVGNVVNWESSVDNGVTWQTIANITQTLQYNGLTTTTQYRALVQNGVCASMYSSISTITVNPAAIQANAGPNDEVCNATVYTLQGNPATGFSGLWTVTSGTGNVSFSDATNPNATVSGLVPGNSYQFTWTISPLAPCTPTSSTVTIKVDVASAGGNSKGTTAACAGSNSGIITLSAQVGNIINWESSIDNGTSWQTIASTNDTITYTNLTQTTQYRAFVQNGVCTGQFSTISIITVNQPVIQANAGGNQSLCGAVSVNLSGNNPSPSTGTWSQIAGPPADIVAPANSQTQVNGLIPGNNYKFLWTIDAAAPCTSTVDTANIADAINSTANFTANKTDGCGTYTVNFTNTSSTINGVSFLWDFGDGSTPVTAVNPSHTFTPRSDGRDTTYTVTLNIVDNCTPTSPFSLKVTIRPQNPVATIFPVALTGCSPFAISVENASPGNNVDYAFYLYNGSTLVQQINKTDKSTAVFNPVSATDVTVIYTVYMVATGYCNNTTQSNQIPITISPPNVNAQMFVEGGINNGCAPLNVTFVNNTQGGNNFYYTIYDSKDTVVAQLTASTSNLPYIFNNAGTYYVTLTASNACYTSVTPKTRLDIYSVPQPQFSADTTQGCKNLTVNFANLTPGNSTSSASSLSYKWDFGDFSQSFLQNPPAHTYNYKNSPYTVTLTATDPVSGCSNTITKTNLINVTSPPATAFSEKPDSITSIPNYTFSFIDQTTGSPTNWYWTFGDGGTSPNENPDHTYPDTGLYKVTLTTSLGSGCDSTITQNVRITGVPGQLFLPNAFEPAGGTSELKIFMAKGSGIKQWHMQIFNNYSELIWETTKLNEKGAPIDGWDGTYKGAPAPQGVYVWQVSATFINGTEWEGNVIKNSLPKRVGTINLIR